MSNALDILKKGIGYAEPVIHAFQLVQSLTGVGGTEAATALKAIDAIVNAVNDGITNGANPKDIIAELDKLAAGVTANDAKADADLEARFSTGGQTP